MKGHTMPIKKKKVMKKKSSVAVKEFSVEWVDINSIQLWGDNPRMNDEASKKLAEIIDAHGVKSPIVCWDKDRTIYKGNTTFKACKLLGYEKVPVVFHEFSSEAAAKAYGIADNKASELSGWDSELLAKIMKSEEVVEQELNTGFDMKEQNLLFASMEKQKVSTEDEKEIDVDGFEFKHQCPKCSYEW